MSNPSEKNTKVLVTLIILIAAITIGGVSYNISKHKRKNVEAIVANLKIDGTVLPKARIINSFQLTDTNGKPFTNENLKNRWTLMFFGFTNCGYVCPTTLAELSKTYTNLRAQLPKDLLPQVVMVSVDPERDNIKKLKSYVTSFNPAFMGIRGDLAATKALADQMSVVFAKVKMPNGNYGVTHSAEIMLLDPTGNLRAFFSYPHQATQMTHDYELIVRALDNQT